MAWTLAWTPNWDSFRDKLYGADHSSIPWASVKYPSPWGEVTFTWKEQDMMQFEAAKTLPEACRSVKLRELQPVWYRDQAGFKVFWWRKIAMEGGYEHGFRDEDLRAELDVEMNPRLEEAYNRMAREKLQLASVGGRQSY
ncbi:MAG: hypothetical protein L6R35_006889 [Caloplaca aegaea]|nr:MAG: hypothetical protein L6R35_006889 [Caloplaca aegaea]